MKKLALLLAGMIVCAWLATGGGSSAFGQRTKPAPKTTTKAETYAVIQIGEEIKVVPGSQLASEKKRVAEDYKREMKAYQDSKKEAGKGKDKVEIPKPVQKKVKVLKSSCKSEKEAIEYRDKLLQDKDEPKPKKKLDW
jgi:hypothetical protein